VSESPFRWETPGVPHRGWTLLYVVDHDEPDHQCEMCGNPEVRYVHHIAHPEYAGELLVGCVCCEKLTGNYTRPRELEARLKSRARRRANWPNRKGWKVSRNGNRWIKHLGHHVVVMASKFGDGWACAVDGTFSRRNYPDQAAAMLAAFDHIDPPTGA
jgi:hypothetical protein